jgi:uncharacterized membrane protein
MKFIRALAKTIGIIGVSSLVFSSSFVTLPAPALTQFNLRRICNKTGFGRVSIALGYQDGVSKGWYNIESGQCINLNVDEVHGIATHFYGKATILTTQRWFGDKSRSFCTTPKRFEIDSTGGCFNGAESRPFGTIGSGINLTW